MKHVVTSCMMSDDVNDDGDVNNDGDAQGGVRRRAQAGLQVGSHLH